ncbi:MAG: sigma-70 family RNA polymerase sigma factor [Isosphaeraceae bacterium]
MPGGSSVAVLRDFQTLFDAGSATGLSDRQLLERFVQERDASADLAFEVLVLRHGPMVLRVCRNLLRNPDDAQDAFQATFLVLVQRSGSIRQLESVGGWLYGVACRVAARARAETARRRKVEERGALRVVMAVEPSTNDESDQAELGPIVQEEVRRLPEKYRAVVVLCYWQGLTHEQAAVQLACPLGTVRSRLARARKLLHRRITRRGLATLAGAVAAVIDGSPASAALVALRLPSVAPALVRSTIRAASHVAAGGLTSHVASGLTAYLVKRTLRSITMLKIGSTLAAVAIVGIVGVGVTVAAQRAGRSPAVGTITRIEGTVASQGDPLSQQSAESDQAAGAADREVNQGRGVKVYSKVQGARILSIAPDGSRVKKGQVICQLDSTALQDQLVNEMITVLTAAASYEQAKSDREVSEVAVVEYAEGLYICELQEAEMNIKIAEAELAIAEDECEEAREAFTKNQKLLKKKVISELQLKKARFALELAQSRKKVLVEYTRGKRIKELKSAVAKERADELATKAVWELKESKRQRLEQQVAARTIKAPIDGKLVYAKPQTGMMMAQIVEEGATVYERQLLFEIDPVTEAKK